MTSGGSQDWRGGRAPRNTGRSNEPAPSWKQPRHSATSKDRGWRNRLRLIVVGVFLLSLVATVIAVMRPAKEYRTHFFQMNLLEFSGVFNTTQGIFPTEELFQTTGYRKLTQCRTESLALDTAAGSNLSDLRKSHVVVIALQTTFVPGPDGQFKCLIRNSTPNLDDANQYADLSTLKDQLVKFQTDQPETPVLLLVDSPPVSLEWRTGYLYADLNQEFEEWTNDLKRLIVVLSCGEHERSEPGTSDTAGRSIFGHFASIGLSSLADQNSNNELTVSEYCDYIAKRTNDWVRTHRIPAGQQIRILPSPDSPEKARDFKLLTDLVPLPASLEEIGGKKTADFTALEKLWNLRQILRERGGDSWDPLHWRSATYKLQRAETAVLHGQVETAAQLLRDASDSLHELETLTNRICPTTSAFNSRRGLVQSDFDGLPSLSRVKHLFQAEPVSSTTSGSSLALAEDVVAAQMRSFPYHQVGLDEPSNEVVENVRSRRASAEAVVAPLVSTSYRITGTIRRLEADLLLSEDRQFIRKPATVEVSERPAPDALIRTITEFAETYERSERTLAAALDAGPSLAAWAALAGREFSDTERSLWTKTLSGNSPGLKLGMKAAPDALSALFDPLSSIHSEDKKDILAYGGLAEELRSESFRLLVYARGLQQNLLFAEPSEGFPDDALLELNENLLSWEAAASESLARVTELSEKMCVGVLQNVPAERPGQVRTYRFLRESLSLTMMSPETRVSVLRTMQDLDGKFAEADNTIKSPVNEAVVVGAASSKIAYEAAWLLQILNLLPTSDPQDSAIKDAWNAANDLEAKKVSEQHEALAQFGNSVREAWKQNQEKVVAALQDTSRNAFEGLRTADQRTRLVSGFDAQLNRCPTQRFRQLKRIHYCLLQAERLSTGLWTEPKDLKPWSQSGWYSKAALSWLNVASESHEAFANEALGPVPFVTEAISDLKATLAKSENLSLQVVPLQQELNLGELDHGTVFAKINKVVDGSISGEAAILTRIPDQSSVVVTNNSMSLPLRSADTETQFEVHRKGAPGRGQCTAVELSPEVFFRGRYWKSDTVMSINPCAPAEFVLEKHARPETARIIVSGSDPRPIVLVLDFSDSMKESLNGAGTPRFLEALATLEGVIASPLVTGSRVILNVYGHRTQFVDGKHNPNPNYVKCFGKEIPPGLRADNDIETEFDRKILNAADRLEFRKVIDKLKCSGPWGTTPLTKAIADAITVTLKEKAGIVIAVTDGEAKDFKDKPLADLRRAIDDHPSTSVRIVAFDLNAVPVQRTELERTFGQFETISIVDASEREQLLLQIFASLDPRKYSASWQAGAKSAEAALGSAIEGLDPALDYSLKFDQIVSDQTIALNRGDVLNADIDHIGRRFVFRREKRSVMKASEAASVRNDTPTILRSTQSARLSDIPAREDSGLKKAELSLMLDHLRDELPVTQPAEIEFEIHPASSTSKFRPPGIHCRFDAGFGAPGWRIIIDEWPRDQLFLADSIWKMERTSPEKVIRWTDLKEHTSVDTAMSNAGSGLPSHSVWVTLRGDELQVRLDPVKSVPRPDGSEPLGDRWSRNLVEDIRIEIGQRDTSDQEISFQPWNIHTRIVRLESGSVRYEFSGDQISPENLVNAEIALTSAAARKTGAVEVRGFQID